MALMICIFRPVFEHWPKLVALTRLVGSSRYYPMRLVRISSRVVGYASLATVRLRCCRLSYPLRVPARVTGRRQLVWIGSSTTLQMQVLFSYPSSRPKAQNESAVKTCFQESYKQKSFMVMLTCSMLPACAESSARQNKHAIKRLVPICVRSRRWRNNELFCVT